MKMYKLEKFDCYSDEDVSGIEQRMNELAREGWEVADTCYQPNRNCLLVTFAKDVPLQKQSV